LKINLLLILATLLFRVTIIHSLDDNSMLLLKTVKEIESQYSVYHHHDVMIGPLGDRDNNFQASPYYHRFWFYSDNYNLYFIALSEVSHNFSEGVQTFRDGQSNGDKIILRIITQDKQCLTYNYYFYPHGTKEDMTTDSNFKNNYQWNSNYEYSSVLNDSLWLVKAKIPFSDMRYSGSVPYNFKVFIQKLSLVENKWFVYPYLTQSMGTNYFRQFSPLVIDHPIERDLGVRTNLHYTADYDLTKYAGSRWYNNIGLDVSFRPSSISVAKMSIQPDFSDTPLDSEVNIYNTKNPTTISENRRFFIEDFDVIALKPEYLYTRQIISPLIALKFNQIGEKNTFSWLILKDQYEYSTLLHSYKLTNRGDYWTALGYKQAYGNLYHTFNAYSRLSDNGKEQSILGYTSLTLTPLRKITFTPEFALSYTKTVYSSQPLRGSTGKVTAEYQDKLLTVTAKADYMSKDFSPRTGAVYDQDRSTLDINLLYQVFPKGEINNVLTNISCIRQFDVSYNSVVFDNVNLTSVFGFKDAISIYLTCNYAMEKANDKKYYSPIFKAGFNQEIKKGIYTDLSMQAGRAFIYANGKPLDVAGFLSLVPVVRVNLNPNSSLSFDANYIKYDYPQTSTFDNEFFLANYNLTTVYIDNLSLTQGLRSNNYRLGGDTPIEGELGYYVNVDWTVSSRLHFTFGYKTSDQRHYSSNNLMGSVWERIHKPTVYFKTELQL